MEIMTYDEYATLPPHSWPYILELQTDTGILVYYGARHSCDPLDPKVFQIEACWLKTQPTLALTEGGVWPIFPTKVETIRRSCEAGLVHFFAARDGVPIRSLEPDPRDEIAFLRQSYSVEALKVFYMVRYLASYRRRAVPEAFDTHMLAVLRHISGAWGLAGPPDTLTELDESYLRLVPGFGRWWESSAALADPTQALAYTNTVSGLSSRYRDEHMVRLIPAALQLGHRLFAVVGGSRVVMQEHALRTALL